MDTPVYNKAYHFWDSPAVFLDIDSFVYIAVAVLLAWLIVKAIRRKKGKEKIYFIEFVSRYMVLCSLPAFIGYLIMLISSGIYTLTNVSICVLPLVYGALIQLVFYIIRKFQARRS